MKRLLRISSNLSVFSLIPILSWFMLGLIVDKNLINIFTLTYPFQFICGLMKSIFATGANISKEKDKNEDAVLSGMTIGTIVGFIIFGVCAINLKSYIEFMNMDYQIYKEFTLYSIWQLYIQLVFSFVLEKLYYEGKEKIANKYCMQFNLLNFMVLMLSAYFLKNRMHIVMITLSTILIYTLIITVKSYRKFNFKLNILNFIRYESVNIVNNILFFIIFLFGLSNALEYGEKYVFALNLIALITDTQWDSFEAISTVAKIDISKGKFNYREHIKNAYKLLTIMLITVFLMLAISFRFYKLDLLITFIYLSFELVNFIIYPIYNIQTCYLQLERLGKSVTVNKTFAGILRMLISLLKTPYCTGMGQVSSSIYQFISVNIMFHRNYKINKNGTISDKRGQI